MKIDAAVRLLSKLPIRDRDSGRAVPFHLNHNQQKLVAAMREQELAGRPIRWICCKARRVGVSSIADGFLWCHSLSQPMANARIVAHLDDSVSELFKVPLGLTAALRERVSRDCVEEPTKTLITFPHAEGNSHLSIATAGSTQGGRGAGISALHLSESSFYRGADSFISLLNTVPNHRDTMVCIESTANGKVGTGQTFYEAWCSAIKGESDYLPIFLSWLDDPTCVRNADEAKDAPVDQDEKDLMKHFHASRAQIAWRRWAIPNLCSNYIEKFYQEYPCCLTAEMRVSTERGIVPIAQAASARTTESGHILKWGPQPPSPIYKMTTKAGRVLRGTHNHPVMTTHGWKDLSKLTQGDIIALRSPRFAEKEYTVEWRIIGGATMRVHIDKDWGRLLGYFCGDGCWYKTDLSVACDAKDKDVHKDVRRILTKLVSPPSEKWIGRQPGQKGCLFLSSNGRDLDGRSAALAVFRRLGLVALGEYPKRIVRVPDCIWRSPKPVIKEFLSTLFECDGSVTNAGTVTFYTKHLQFAQEIQLLLLGFGINVTIHTIQKAKGSGGYYTGYELYFRMEGSEQFFDQIHFIGERKRNRRKFGKPKVLNGMTDLVESVVEDGEEVTYDFTIEGSHEFSAQGILTHNTPEEAFVSTGNPAFVREELAAARASVRKGISIEWLRKDDHTVTFREGGDGALIFWAQPDPTHKYYLGADAAQGQGEGDFAAAVVLDGTTNEVTARFADRVTPATLAILLNALGRHFNNAMVNIELTGGWGDWAQSVLRDKFRYPNFYLWKGLDDKAQQPRKRNAMGWTTTWRSRERLFTSYRDALREQELLVRDEQVVVQMEQAEREAGRWEVKRGHDDILFAMMLSNIACQHYPPMRRAVTKKQTQTETDPEESLREHVRFKPSIHVEAGKPDDFYHKMITEHFSRSEVTAKRREKGMPPTPLEGI